MNIPHYLLLFLLVTWSHGSQYAQDLAAAEIGKKLNKPVQFKRGHWGTLHLAWHTIEPNYEIEVDSSRIQTIVEKIMGITNQHYLIDSLPLSFGESLKWYLKGMIGKRELETIFDVTVNSRLTDCEVQFIINDLKTPDICNKEYFGKIDLSYATRASQCTGKKCMYIIVRFDRNIQYIEFEITNDSIVSVQMIPIVKGMSSKTLMLVGQDGLECIGDIDRDFKEFLKLQDKEDRPRK